MRRGGWFRMRSWRPHTVLLSVLLFCVSIILFSVPSLCESNEQKGLISVDVKNDDDSNDGVTDTDEGENTGNAAKEEFHPTNEWKTIKPGQAIPAGLHVRLNLQTGQKEAKLMDKKPRKENRDEPELFAKIGKDGSARKSNKKFSHQELRDALQNFEVDDFLEASEEEVQRVRSKFRSIDELKKDFADLSMNMKSSSEQIGELIDAYKQANDEKKWHLLNDIEYLVHKYDVAQDFVKMGGLELLLSDLNSTNSTIRSYAAFTMGSAAQGNPSVQISMYEGGALQHLLRLISLDPDQKVKSSALYAVSCLVRQFPLAQYHLSKSGGLSVFVSLFKSSDIQSMKLQLKVVTLLHDLIAEQQLTSKNIKDGDALQKAKMKQYETFPILAAFVKQGFCSLIPKLLQAPDADTQEKVIKTMLLSVEVCKEEFQSSTTMLHNLLQTYQELAEKEGGTAALSADDPALESSDYYYTMLMKLIEDLLKRVETNRTQNDVRKDEL